MKGNWLIFFSISIACSFSTLFLFVQKMFEEGQKAWDVVGFFHNNSQILIRWFNLQTQTFSDALKYATD